MTDNKTCLRLFLDEGVPDAVGRVFEKHGHHVIYLREAIATGSPDELVCVAAIENDSILVALDGDMKKIAKKSGVSGSRFAKLSLIKLSCKAPMADKRVEQAMSLIEHEWDYSDKKVARRLYIEIKPDVIRTLR